MLRVTLEMVPKGREENKRLLGVMTVANDGTGTETKGNYRVKITKWGGVGTWKTGYVKGFPRKSRLHGPWDLLYLALRALTSILFYRNRSLVREEGDNAKCQAQGESEEKKGEKKNTTEIQEGQTPPETGEVCRTAR